MDEAKKKIADLHNRKIGITTKAIKQIAEVNKKHEDLVKKSKQDSDKAILDIYKN